jgi:ubiquinone/menaquinone biosynthesis C-methylase UbiE
MMDQPLNDPRLLQDDLNHLRVINKYFGGWSAVYHSISPLIQKVNHPGEIQILDLGTGSADHPIELVKKAERWKRNIHITAIDKNKQILQFAHEQTKDHLTITLRQEDILSLPFSDKSFDIVLCSLAIHHFSREDVKAILQTMNRISRVGFIVNDLYRSWPGAWAAWIYTHLTSRNPITRNDAYVSVLRAFTPEEIRGMATEIGLRQFKISTHPMFRLILVGEHK